jgi:DNA-binding NarL/FixJ family response regulator
MKNNISVIIIDDHPIVLQGFSHILQNEDHIQLLDSFTSAREGIAYLEEHPVDVVLLDINMPDMNGIEACERIGKSHPNAKVIAISNNNENSIIQRMLQSGASGYILKNASADELVQCIREAVEGKTALSEDVKTILQSAKLGNLPKITRREAEILQLLAQGLTSPEIAEKMFVSPLTIETHRRNLIQKFEVSNSAALIHKAMELKYI